MYRAVCLDGNKELNRYAEPPPCQRDETNNQVSVIENGQVNKKIVVDRYKEGKVLAKMLSKYPKGQYFTDRFDKEISELRTCKIIRASSVSLLIPEKKCDLYRHIGLLLDSGSCTVRGVYSHDACVTRIDNEKDEVIWCDKSNQFLKSETKTATTYTGDFRWLQKSSGAKEFSCLGALVEYSNKTPALVTEDILCMNEVVVDYGVDAIIGVLGTKNIETMSSHSVSEQELHKDLIGFSLKIKELSKRDCLIFEYDMSSATLFMVDPAVKTEIQQI